MLRTGPEEHLSHTNPECRCSDRQTKRSSEEKVEQRGGEVGKAGRQTKLTRLAGKEVQGERANGFAIRLL